MSHPHAPVAVILNPRANSGNGARRWKSVLETGIAARAGVRDALVFDGTGEGGLAGLRSWVAARLSAGTERFVAAGGDGTLHLALNELMHQRPGGSGWVLGAIGLGSSNDFHKPGSAHGRSSAAGMPCRLDFDSATPHDLGLARVDGSGNRYFAINASVGVTAEANGRFNEAGGGLGWLKGHWVDGAIVAAALGTFTRFRALDAELRVGGGEWSRLALTNLGVVKNPHFSGQMRYDLCQPKDDGIFGIHLCEAMSRFEMIQALSALSSGRFSGRPKTRSLQASKAEVRSAQAFAVETDGEVVRGSYASFVCLRREARLCP